MMSTSTSEPSEGNKRKRSRLGKCDVCQTKDAIYTCPRCEAVSCGLDCVKKHKKDLDCDGVRVRTKYVPKDKLDEISLLSDYRLLEDVRRCVESVERYSEALETYKHSVSDTQTANASNPKKICLDHHPENSEKVVRPEQNEQKQDVAKAQTRKIKRGRRKHQRPGKIAKDDGNEGNDESSKGVSPTSTNKAMSNPNQAAISARLRSKILKSIRQGGMRREKAFETLQKAVLTRGVILNFLPEHFQRHWENTSYFFARENLVYWHVKVAFINANCYTLSLSECSESLTLKEIVQRCFNRSRNFHLKQKTNDPLETYRKLGVSKVQVLMVADKLPNSARKFYILDMDKSLRDNFEGKCIIEFPQFCVALENCTEVSSVQKTVSHNFFEEEAESESDDESNESEKSKKKTEKRKKAEAKKANHASGIESGRESGELSESSEDSEPELFQEKEFRSIYQDLLKTFDTDVTKP